MKAFAIGKVSLYRLRDDQTYFVCPWILRFGPRADWYVGYMTWEHAVADLPYAIAVMKGIDG